MYMDRQILEQAEIIGFRGADGIVVPTTKFSKTGRILDFVEIDGDKIVGGDLKSKSEIINGIQGGLKKAGKVEAKFKDTTKYELQKAVEEKIKEAASKANGKIIIVGYDVKTGESVTKEVAVEDYQQSLKTYDDHVDSN